MKNTEPTASLAPKWMSVQTAAQWSGFSDRHIEELAHTGQIVSSNVIQEGKSRGRRLILVESLDSFIMAGVSRPPAELAMNSSRADLRAHLHDGNMMTIAELCELSPLDMSPAALRFRLDQGWPMNRALNEPFASRAESGAKGARKANSPRARKVTVNGQTLTVAEMARKAGISRQTASERIRRGWSPEDAVSLPSQPKPPKRWSPLPNETIIVHGPGIVQESTNNAPREAPPELIDRAEAARRLCLSIRTIDEMIASGDLSVVRIGRTVRIRPSAIAHFVEARETRGRGKSKRASETKKVNRRERKP